MEVLLNAGRRGSLEDVEPVEAGLAFDWSLVQCHSVYYGIRHLRPTYEIYA